MASRKQNSSPSNSTTLEPKGSSLNPGSATLKPAQKVLGFLRKRSGITTTAPALAETPTTTLTGRDRTKPIVIPPPSVTDTVGANMSTPGQNSSHGSTGKANPFKNIIRRKSLELGRFFDGNTRPSSQGSNNGSKASLNLDVSQNTPTAHDIEATLETSRAGTPTPTFSPRPITRRPAFTLGLPWRPQSEYFSQGSPGVQTSLSKSQKRFIRAFPELADIAKVPAAYCLPCLATPPQTPPPEHLRTPGSTTMSPSNTLSTLTSSALSTTSSTTTLACPGHFHDYSCALEREILWQGTLYVAATHVCFYGKHFGKTVKVIIDYRDLIMIEREKKMGVFPSSIRLRVAITYSDQSSSAPRHSQDTKGTTINKDSAVVALSGTQTTKDYVLTSLMSREQAFADIERNWQAHRQFQTTTCIGGLLTPQMESPGGSEKNLAGLIDGESGAGSGFGIDSRFRSRGMLDMHKVPRTYSVVTDEAFSSSENLNRPHLRERASTSLIRPSTPTSHDTISSWVAAAAVATSGSDFPIQAIGNPIVAFEGRRGSVASVGSSDKQEPTSGLIGFLQRRSSLVHKWKKSESGGRGDNLSDSGSDAAQDHGEDITRLPLDASAVGATVATAQQLIVQDPPVLAAQRQVDSLRSSTPPPTLISPSLTTTKVSRSLSTAQMDAKPGSMHGMTKHTRDESSDALLVISNDNGTSRAASPVISTPTLHPRSELLPSDPVTCGCSRHYKNAVVSTVVPLPVDLCFEILFSAAGAGLGDKLGCDTHRLKDGSTDILIMPWLHEDQPQGSNRTDWEDRQRKLEYSVSFKVPMLAKTSTACFEIQKVTQFSPFAILVHSESKTPNVPYGEHFSTVNQICMTWESEGRTRIKCFTEVKFKRSIMWSSKVEAGSLEGSGGFYKEFVRQLEQLVESSRDQLLCSYEARLLASLATSNPSGDVNDPAMSTAECISGSEETRPLLSPRPSFGSTHDRTRIVERLPTPVPVQEPAHLGPQEMSRARSLLSQQFHRNPPLSNAAGLPRLSLDSARPPLIGTSSFVAQKSPLSTSTLPLEKKSALSIFIQSMTPPTYPIVSMAPEGPTGGAKASPSSSTATSTAIPVMQVGSAQPSSSMPTLSWIDLVKKSLSLLGHNSAATTDNGAPSFSSPALSSPITPTFGGGSARVTDKTGSPRVTFAVPTLPPSTTLSESREADSSAYIVKDRSYRQQNRRDYVQLQSPRKLSKVLLGCVILGLAVSAFNIWQLFSVVSSVVEVVQLKDDVFRRQLYHPRHAPTYHHRHYSYQHHPETTNWKRARRPDAWRPSSALTPAAAVQSHSRTASSSFSSTRKTTTYTSSNKPRVHSPQNYLSDEALLGPLQIQTAILRTEIIELFDLLEQARKELHHSHPQRS